MDADRIKEFFIQHLEKMAFAVFVGLAGYCVYAGIQKPSILSEYQPDQLSDKAQQVKQSIDVDHTEMVTQDRIMDFDIVKRTKRIDTPVDPTLYSLPNLWQDVDATTVVRRSDPDLFPPLELNVVGIATLIAGKMDVVVDRKTRMEKTYSLGELEEADEVEKAEARPQRRGRRPRRNEMEDAMMDGMEGMDGMDPGMMGMEPSMAMTTGAGRFLDGEQDRSGFRPVADSRKKPAPKVGWFIAGTALLPYKSIYQSYENSLKDAKGYNPVARDTPNFYDLQVERADVTDKSVDELGEEDWKMVWNRLLMLQLAAARWQGFAPELVPSDYRDPALTMVVPPVLLDDYQWYTSNPKIPLKTKQQLNLEAQQILLQKENDNQPEYKVGGEGGFLKDPNDPSNGMNMGIGMNDGMNMGARTMGGMMGQGVVETDPVEHKLIRFYDFAGFPGRSPEPGRSYVYRIRYGVVDPNFPKFPQLQPASASLTPDVAKRIMTLVAKAEEDKDRGTLYVRYGEWSAPSPPATLPSFAESFVGPVEPLKMLKLRSGNRNIEIPRYPPKAEVVASVLDPDLGTRIPLTMEVTAGSVMSAKAESVDVIDPVTFAIKKHPNANVNTGITVVSIDGGKTMSNDEELTEPGLMLLMDANGNLNVADSIEQQRNFRTYSYAEEKGK